MNHILALAKARGNGSGERAACSVVVVCVYGLLGQEHQGIVRQAQYVQDHIRVLHVSALHKDCPWSQGQYPLPCLRLGFLIADLHAGEHLSLWDIGGEQIRKRHKFAHKGLHSVFLQKPASALAHRYGIDDQGKILVRQILCHCVNEFRVEKHARLGRMDGKALKDGLELHIHELGRGREDAIDAKAVLRSQRRYGAHAIAAHGHDGLQIRLYARSATAVRARYGQDVGYCHDVFLTLCNCPGKAPQPGTFFCFAVSLWLPQRGKSRMPRNLPFVRLAVKAGTRGKKLLSNCKNSPYYFGSEIQLFQQYIS